MKIGNRLRDLLMRQSETYMLDNKHAQYFDETYSFKPVTEKEFLAQADHIRKLLVERNWAKDTIKRLFNLKEEV